MGFTDWFTFRTKEQKQAEARQYARWACPYGDAQREKLTGREAYQGGIREPGDEPDTATVEEKRIRAAKKLRRSLQGRIGIEMARYIALIEADAQVDETLNYPTPDALMAAGDELLQWLKAHKEAIKR